MRVVAISGLGLGLALAGCASLHRASNRAPCPPVSGEPYLPCQVDTDASPAHDPVYPPMLRAANVDGSARAAYVVDSTGRVASFQVLRSAHDLFSNSIRNAIGTSAFTPARREGHAVAVRHEAFFEFISDSLGGILPTTARHDTLPDGTPRTTIEAVRREPVVTRKLTDAELVEVKRVTLEKVVEIASIDSVKSQPHVISITPWTRDVSIVMIVKPQGNGDIGYRCSVVRAVTPWNVQCQYAWFRVS